MFRLAASPSIRPVREESVSERLRREKELLLGSGPAVPVTGQYYDVIRATQQVRTRAPQALTNAFVRGINNKVGGVKSFAAANYNYPSGQMVIGASLAGMCGSCGSPSEDRKRQMERLMGLGFDFTQAVGDFGSALKEQWDAMPFAGKLSLLAAGAAGRTFDFDGKKYKVDCLLREMVRLSPDGSKFIACSDALSQLSGVISGDFSGLGNLAVCLPTVIRVLGGAASCAVASAAPTPPQSAPPAAPPPRKMTPGEIQNILKRNLPTVNVRRNVPQIRVLNLPPPKPFIPGPTSSSAGNAGIIAAGVAAVGVAAFLLLRKKKSAAA